MVMGIQLNKIICFLACLFFIVGNLKAQDQNKIREKSLSVFFTPDVSIVDKNYTDDVNSKINLWGFSLKYSNRNAERRSYFSYGLQLDRNAISKDGLPDISKSSDAEGSEIKTFDYKHTFTYIAPSIEFNYLLINSESHRLGASVGLYFRYFLSQKLDFNLSDGTESASLSASEITNNNLYNNPGVMTSIWYEWKLHENIFFHSGIDYNCDTNMFGSVPAFQKVGVSLGVVFNIGRVGRSSED